MWQRRGKFNARKVEVAGRVFPSIRQGKRYRDLMMLELVGEISELRLEVPFVLAPAVVLNGRKKPCLKYVADFTYKDKQGGLVVEDSKGVRTPVYRMKAHLMKHIHGIDILET